MTPAQAEWSRCRAWIEAATHESALAENIEAVEAKLAAGHYHLDSSPRAAVIVEFCEFGGKPVLLARYGGGDLQEIFNVIEPRLHAIAKKTNRLFMAEGRLGWLKAAKQRGWKLAWISMVKE